MSYLDYLKAAKIAPIMIETREDTGETWLVGKGLQYNDHAVWVSAQHRGRVIRWANRALEFMSSPRDREHVVQALNAAAKHYGVTLTPHLVVIARAARLSLQLDETLEAMKQTGMLKHFHREYARHRAQRQALGVGYMNFATAQRRFRNAIIGRLVGLRDSQSDSRLIEEVLSGRSGE